MDKRAQLQFAALSAAQVLNGSSLIAVPISPGPCHAPGFIVDMKRSGLCNQQPQQIATWHAAHGPARPCYGCPGDRDQERLRMKSHRAHQQPAPFPSLPSHPAAHEHSSFPRRRHSECLIRRRPLSTFFFSTGACQEQIECGRREGGPGGSASPAARAMRRGSRKLRDQAAATGSVK